MRYAIPVTNGVLSSHFGHCQNFVLFDVDDMKKEIITKTVIDSPPHQPGVLPGWLAGEGVSMIIAGGMGSRAQELFIQNNIQVILGAPDVDPDLLLHQHLTGTMETSDNICDH